MIRTVIADDSAAFRAALKALLTPAEGFEVVGEAATGVQAVRLCTQLRPALVLMDVVMPVLDGLAATEQLMCEAPCPVVVLSGELDQGHQALAFQALRAGAVEVMSKPKNLSEPKSRAAFLAVLTAMAAVRVVSRRRSSVVRPPVLVVVGASTGGPRALEVLVRSLPDGFECPVLVAQHIASGFSSGLQRWLQASSYLPVRLVETSAPLSASIFLAADDRHLQLEDRRVVATPPHGDEATPSVDRLFTSALCHPGRVLGVLLSGMGSDGAKGCGALRARGNRIIVQDEATSLVFGMPRVAVEQGHADEVLPLEAIAPRLVELARFSR
jgi:two-component system chemotaxis response regulator CheB